MTTATGDIVRLAAVADIHYARASQGMLHSLLGQIADSADVLLLCGDLTDFGLAEEARVLARDLTTIKIPVVGVLGNHDLEGGEEQEIIRVLSDAGVRILDGEVFEHRGIGFAGVRGFCGGFGRGALGPWGERIIKDFVQEAVREALKLEAALARLHTDHRIVLMHYSPVRDTVQGEPEEIYAFLGSSRLEEPLTRFAVTAVFHGHAHRGTPEGKTATGIPVYNVSHVLLRAAYPDRPPYRVFEVKVGGPPDGSVVPIGEGSQWGRRSSDNPPGERRSA